MQRDLINAEVGRTGEGGGQGTAVCHQQDEGTLSCVWIRGMCREQQLVCRQQDEAGNWRSFANKRISLDRVLYADPHAGQGYLGCC